MQRSALKAASRLHHSSLLSGHSLTTLAVGWTAGKKFCFASRCQTDDARDQSTRRPIQTLMQSHKFQAFAVQIQEMSSSASLSPFNPPACFRQDETLPHLNRKGLKVFSELSASHWAVVTSTKAGRLTWAGSNIGWSSAVPSGHECKHSWKQAPSHTMCRVWKQLPNWGSLHGCSAWWRSEKPAASFSTLVCRKVKRSRCLDLSMRAGKATLQPKTVWNKNERFGSFGLCFF